jgi:hypothetical protein
MAFLAEEARFTAGEEKDTVCPASLKPSSPSLSQLLLVERFKVSKCRGVYWSKISSSAPMFEPWKLLRFTGVPNSACSNATCPSVRFNGVDRAPKVFGMASGLGFPNSILMGESFTPNRQAGGFDPTSRDELSLSSDLLSWLDAPRDMPGVTF